MKSWLIDAWLRISNSYWFIPSLMAAGALLLSAVMIELDIRIGDDWLKGNDWLTANQPDGARALLSTVAGSMITVAGVTFSMTLLAVSHASAQIGPRLLAGFMGDRGNQVTLGIFIATFLYCLMVLRTVRAVPDGADGSDFVPHAAVVLAMVLAVLSVAVLIYFIHHVPQSINTANLVARVGDDFVQCVTRAYPQAGDDGAVDTGDAGSVLRQGEDELVVRFEGAGGYLRIFDVEGLLSLAGGHDLSVELEVRPGDFRIAGQPLLRAWPASHVSDELVTELASVFSFGRERNRSQDVLFPAEQLLEVCGRALSPGVNDQYTAILCIDQLERGLAAVAGRAAPRAICHDSDGVARVHMRPVGRNEFIAAVFGPLRQYVRGDWIATRRVLDMGDRLLSAAGSDAVAVALRQELALLCEEAAFSSLSAHERSLVAARAPG